MENSSFWVDKISNLTLGDWIGIISLVITMVGFIVTSLYARSAASNSKQAYDKMQLYSAVVSLSETAQMLEKIRTFNRIGANAHELMVDYERLAKNISSQAYNKSYNEQDRKFLLEFLEEVRVIQNNVEINGVGSSLYDWTSVNKRLASYIDQISRIMAGLEANYNAGEKNGR